MDVVQRILDHNAGREPERLQMKYDRMRSSPFVFLRGTCHLFYRRLPDDELFATAPKAWCCGDLHFENVGSYEGDNRQTYFDVNDFDEAALAPVTWDLVRLLSSLRVGADTLGIDAETARALCRVGVDAYAEALQRGKAFWIERDVADGVVRELLDHLRQRDRASFLAERTRGKGRSRRLKVDGRRVLKATDVDQARVRAFMATFAATRPDPEFFRVLDVERRVAGTGSLGLPRWVVLVHGDGGEHGPRLLDLKVSMPSSLDRRLRGVVTQPAWPDPATRIVTLQQRLQAVPMARLQAVRLDDQPAVLRELQPTEDRVSLDRATTSPAELRAFVAAMGRLAAWAHLRAGGQGGSATADELIDFGRRRKWRERLLDAAEAMARQVERDAATYAAAHDDGVFRVAEAVAG